MQAPEPHSLQRLPQQEAQRRASWAAQRAVSKQASNPTPLNIDEPKRERPNASKRVVSSNREHASKAGRWIVSRGKRQRQQPPGKRRATRNDQDEDASQA